MPNGKSELQSKCSFVTIDRERKRKDKRTEDRMTENHETFVKMSSIV